MSVNDADALRGGSAVTLDGHVNEVVHQQVGLVDEGGAVVALGQVFVKFADIIHISRMNRQLQIYERNYNVMAKSLANYLNHQ